MGRIEILTTLRELNCNNSGIYWCKFNGKKELLVKVENNVYALVMSFEDAQLLRVRDDVQNELIAMTQMQEEEE